MYSRLICGQFCEGSAQMLSRSGTEESCSPDKGLREFLWAKWDVAGVID